jgi:aspartate-semialdehyde dehydrogenase
MNSGRVGTLGLIAFFAGLSAISGGQAIAGNMKPELAAKKENHRKQEEQRITKEKRKVAVDALKAERLKIYKAKQEALNANNLKPESK